MLKKYFWLLLFLVVSHTLLSQQKKGILVTARVFSDSIFLRWAPNDAVLWKLLNKHGYRIERYTIRRNGKLIKQHNKKVLQSVIKPINDTIAWARLMDNNNYAAVAAQALFGETFQIAEKDSNNVMQIVNKVRETEMRYSYTLLASDMSYEAARLAGLGFTDKNVDDSEDYLYRIYPLGPDSTNIDYGYVYTNNIAFRELPKISSLRGEFNEGFVTLKWNGYLQRNAYTGYIVEKSLNGKDFRPISDVPFVTTNELSFNNQYITKVDSIDINKKYFYRVAGINAFGEKGPYSNIVTGIGIEAIKEGAEITSFDIKQGSIMLHWQIVDTTKYFTGFNIYRAKSDKGKFQRVNKKVLGRGELSFVDNNPISTAYYKLGTLSKVNGSKGEFISHPYLVQMQDSTPPLPPEGIMATIDTTGLVQLNWTKNSEQDLLGYRVYRSNFKQSEFTQITSRAISKNTFSDSVNVSSLTRHTYYKLVAIDTRYNQSNFSNLITVIKPDLIPPVPPLITNVVATNEGIRLKWINSSSTDVIKNVLYRKTIESSKWKLVGQFGLDSLEFKDTHFRKDTGSEYQYVLVAVDSGLFESDPSNVVRIRPKNVLKEFPQRVFKMKWENGQNIFQIKWRATDVKHAKSLFIYRSVNNEPVSLFAKVDWETNSFRDNLQPNSNNTDTYYYLQMLFDDGSKSKFSNKINIKD